MKNIKISLVCLSFLLSGNLFAEQQKRGKRKPPQEALAACDGKSSGSSCTFEGRRGTATGTCFAPSSDLPLACKPKR